jgi:hypothetical protein
LQYSNILAVLESDDRYKKFEIIPQSMFIREL